MDERTSLTTEIRPPPPHPMEAYTPAEIAARVESAGVAKANLGGLQTITLGVLAGAFIAFGAALYTLAMTGNNLGLGPGRLLGGVAFSLGLVLVVVAGAELFTGNNLIVMAWADRRITAARLLRNWTLVYIGNFIGALATAVIVVWSGVLDLGDGAVAATAVRIAEAKVALSFSEAFFRGVLANVLVCLAVWLCFAAHSVTGKILAIVFPITAFVALGFEHSVANMYLIPVGMMVVSADQASLFSLGGIVGVFMPDFLKDTTGATLTLGAFIDNLIPVTLGNIVGGGALVALVYWIIYRRRA